ncbi:MAG: 23S rRNA (uracil(1939)-C(5))-methyltransferase RlmD [Elusimicrobiota bacterium]
MICDHFGVCGGCSQQNIAYEQQLAQKELIVKNELSSISIKEFNSILPSPDLFFFRNKMEFSFGNERDIEIYNKSQPSPRLACQATWQASSTLNVHIGLHPKGRFALVVPTPNCLILSKESQVILNVVQEWANQHKITTYVRKNGLGDLRHLVIREGKNTGERLVNLVAKSQTPHIDELAISIQKTGLVSCFTWTAHDGRSDVVTGPLHKIFWGPGWIQEKLGTVLFQVHPFSFFQTNTKAAENMIGLLRNKITEVGTIGSNSRLIDLYCGVGSIALNLCDLFDETLGVEISPDSVKDAVKNTELNNKQKVSFQASKAEDMLSLIEGLTSSDTVVVDPPRAGLHPKVIEATIKSKIKKLFYVSCNPESLKRDLLLLTSRFSVDKIQPMDFFPHTPHIETVAFLSAS